VLEAREEAERRLARFGAIRTEIGEEEGHEEDRSYWLLTVSAGEHGARATIRWADEAIAALDELERTQRRSRSGAGRRTR